MTFTPTSGGQFTATLSFPSNAVGSPFTVALSGTGLQAEGHLTANTSTDFGDVAVGTSVFRVFTFSNVGTAPATNVQASVSGTGLTMTANDCGTAAAPGTIAGSNGTCSVTVQYAPTSGSTLAAGSVQVLSSAPTTPPC